jgi:hypothetical protein
MKMWIATFVIIVALAMALFTFNRYEPVLNQTMGECTVDADCVDATCCHASSCVASSKAPDCTDSFCSQECAEGTMDCGAGSCKCVNNACKAIMTQVEK